jgi:hypothetical protein
MNMASEEDFYDFNDISQLRVVILIEDINDNSPKFEKNLYQIGIMSDVQKAEIILESFVSYSFFFIISSKKAELFRIFSKLKVTDADSSSQLKIEIVKSTFRSNLDFSQSSLSRNYLNINQIPFSIEHVPISQINKDSPADGTTAPNSSKFLKFRLVANVNFKEAQFFRKNQNPFFEFNLSVSDSDDPATHHSDSTLIQLMYINKNQRVKLVFAKPFDKVLQFQDEFQAHVSNLTGHKAIIDKINIYTLNKNTLNSNNGTLVDESSSNNSSRRFLNATTTTTTTTTNTNNNQYSLTEMVLHFINNNEKSVVGNLDQVAARNDLIIDAEKILAVLDRSKDTNLIKKYKLVLAEKYDEQSSYKFYKYGGSEKDEEVSSSRESDFSSNYFLGSLIWQPNSKFFYVRIFLFIVCVTLVFVSILIVIVCCCMRSSYKRKLKAERALVKAFGLEHRSLTYNDTINGYVNAAFDSNSLLPIPGTNLYAYEGSNPVWLKKYDKLDNKNNQSSNSNSGLGSSASSTNGGGSGNEQLSSSSSRHKQQQHIDDVSSFYLKQIDSSPPTSKCSPSSYNSASNDKSSGINNINKTMTSDVYSIQDAYSNMSPTKKSSVGHSEDVDSLEKVSNASPPQQLSSFKSQPETTTALLTFLKTTNTQNNGAVSSSNVQIVSINHNKHQHQQQQQQQPKVSEVVSFRAQLKNISEKYSENENLKNRVALNESPMRKLNPTAAPLGNKYTKIFDSNTGTVSGSLDANKHQQHQQQQQHSQLTQKEFCDLFEVESTVI